MEKLIAPANRSTRKEAIRRILDYVGEEIPKLPDCIVLTMDEVMSNVIQHEEGESIEIEWEKEPKEVVIFVHARTFQEHSQELSGILLEARYNYEHGISCGFFENDGHGFGHTFIAGLTTDAEYDSSGLIMHFAFDRLPNPDEVRFVY